MAIWDDLLGGIFGGIGQAVGKVAGKATEWIPSPAQHRRNKIHALTAQMLHIQSIKPFDKSKYDKLSDERDKLEQDAINV